MTGKNFSNRLTNLKFIRKDKGLTRAELSRMSGVNETTIKFLEDGINNADNVKLSTLVALAKALKVKARKLVDNETAKYL